MRNLPEGVYALPKPTHRSPQTWAAWSPKPRTYLGSYTDLAAACAVAAAARTLHRAGVLEEFLTANPTLKHGRNAALAGKTGLLPAQLGALAVVAADALPAAPTPGAIASAPAGPAQYVSL